MRPIHRVLRAVTGQFLREAEPRRRRLPDRANTPEGVKHLLAEMDRTPLDGPRRPAGAGAAHVPATTCCREGLELLPEPLRDVDAARFDVMLDRLALSVQPLPDIDYRNDAMTVAAMVAKGAADAAILLRPVSVTQIETVAEAGLRMPQKTTLLPAEAPDRPRLPLARPRLARRQVDFGAGRAARPAGVEAGGGRLLGGQLPQVAPGHQLAGRPVVGVGAGDDEGSSAGRPLPLPAGAAVTRSRMRRSSVRLASSCTRSARWLWMTSSPTPMTTRASPAIAARDQVGELLADVVVATPPRSTRPR